MSSIYPVQPGQSIWDVTLNTCGALVVGDVNNLDEILQANWLLDWTPNLSPGQLITIPDSVSIDINALQQLQLYPVCNSSVSNYLDQINGIFDTLADNWILSTGIWNGDALWLGDGIWNPGN